MGASFLALAKSIYYLKNQNIVRLRSQGTGRNLDRLKIRALGIPRFTQNHPNRTKFRRLAVQSSV